MMEMTGEKKKGIQRQTDRHKVTERQTVTEKQIDGYDSKGEKETERHSNLSNLKKKRSLPSHERTLNLVNKYWFCLSIEIFI